MRERAKERERPEGGQDGADALGVAAGLHIQDVAGLQVQVGDVVLAFQQVIGVDDQDGGLAGGIAAHDVHVLLVALRRDAADEGQGDGEGEGLAVGDGQDSFGADFAEGEDTGVVGGNQEDVTGNEPGLADRGAEVTGEEGAQVVGLDLAAVHDLDVGEGGLGGQSAGLGDEGEEGAAGGHDFERAGLDDLADHLHLGHGGVARGEEQDVAGGEREVLGGVGAGKEPGQVDGDAVPAAGDEGGLGQLGAGGGSAADGEQVEQVHALVVLVLAGDFGACAEEADLAGAALAQCDGDFGLVELVGQAARQETVQAVQGQARRVDLADNGVVEGAVGQERDAGLEVLVAPHGDVELVLG